MDWWFFEEDYSHSSSSSGSLPESLFDAYEGSFNGCVPLPEPGCRDLELEHSELTKLATIQLQQVFQDNMQMNATHLTTKDSIFQQSQLEFSATDRGQPSSSSSSLRSLSGCSPDCSPPLNNSKTINQDTRSAQSRVSPYQAPMLASREQCSAKFPNMGSDDVELTRAMLAVISSGSATSSSAFLSDQPPRYSQTNREPSNGRWGAFKPYNSFLALNYEAKPNSCSQKMIKKAVSMLRMINRARAEAPVPESRLTANQLHHVISERKRREKLNGSFHALRLLLPPGSKKDKASVLVNTKNYLNALKAQISELEKKNRVLEMRLPPTDGSKELTDPSNKVKVQIFKASQSTFGVQELNLRITVMVECDIIEFALHMLECLKEMRAISLSSVDANTYLSNKSFYACATFALQFKAQDWDEEWFKEVVAKAVDSVA